jgi:hypothetical protein
LYNALATVRPPGVVQRLCIKAAGSPAGHILCQQRGDIRISAASQNFLFLTDRFVALVTLPHGAFCLASGLFLFTVWFGHGRLLLGGYKRKRITPT